MQKRKEGGTRKREAGEEYTEDEGEVGEEGTEKKEKQETTVSLILIQILEPQRKAHCKGVKPVSTEDVFVDVTGTKS